jgi:hypothetical protein
MSRSKLMSTAAVTTPSRESTTPDPASSGRDQRGRFAKGNKGGPGNPFSRQVAALRTALLDNVKAEDMAAIVRALIDRAKTGGVAAAKLVFAYVLGKPAEAVDPDQLDVEEWQHFKDTASMYEEMPQLGMAPEPQLPLEMVRFSQRVMSELCRRQMAEMLHPPAAETPPKPASPPPAPSPIGENGAVTAPPSPIGGDGETDNPLPPLDAKLLAIFRELFASPVNGRPSRRPASHGCRDQPDELGQET